MRLRSEGLSWQEIDGELVILDLKSSMYLTTNKTGAYLAKQLEQDRTEEQLVESLVTHYNIDRAAATSDTRAFVQALDSKGLLA